MEKGVNTHNWFSLSIEQYILECREAIDSFNETKTVVVEHAKHIDKAVKTIENAQIVKQLTFDHIGPMDIPEFFQSFEVHRKQVLSGLVAQYKNIGDQYLNSIKESTTSTSVESNKEGNTEEMKLYYAYWERRIFNAITKMIVRALAANKTIWIMQEPASDVPCLIKMRSSYNHPDVQFHPNEEEVNTQLKKFTSNILESTKFFGRWWDGYCKIFDEVTQDDNAERFIPFTFFDDVM